MSEETRRVELTMGDRGRWIVIAGTGTLAFDLGTRMVETVDENGGWRRILPDHGLRLQVIDTLRVGEPGRWWMHRPSDGIEGPVHSFFIEPVTSIVSAWTVPATATPVSPYYLGLAQSEKCTCRLLSIEQGELEALAADLQLLRVTSTNGRNLYPAFQLTAEGAILPGLSEVLCALADSTDDAWTWWAFCARPRKTWGDRTVWELLRDGDIETASRAASRAAWAWRK